MLDTLREKPGQYLDEMVVFLWDEFEVYVPKPTISRTLRSVDWSARQVAKERKRIGFRRTGWSPLGVTSVQIAQFRRGLRKFEAGPDINIAPKR